MKVTLENAKQVRLEAFSAAVVATQKYIDEVLKGEDAYTCGFAWVKVKPKHKGNTKEGGKKEKYLLPWIYKKIGLIKGISGGIQVSLTFKT